MPGTLYVVATPIGNLEDISLRALRILKEASLIAAEDTRVTRKLLSHYDIHTPLTSYHQHTRGEKTDSLVDRLVAGEDVALVSDAGMPGISDPGSDLITAAIEAGIRVVPIPGPSAGVSALVISGLFTGRFAFDGFPPRPKADRREFFASLRSERRTIILYEAPTRVLQTLEDLRSALGERPVAVARELTKLFEEVYRGTLSGAIAAVGERKPRGEHTLVIGGASSAPSDSSASVHSAECREGSDSPSSDEAIRAALQAAMAGGASSRDAIRLVAADLHLPRRYVYSLFLEMRAE